MLSECEIFLTQIFTVTVGACHQKQQDLALLCPHLAVKTLQPLLEQKARHPRLPVCPVRDRKHAFIDAAKTPWVECLADDEGSQLLTSGRTRQQHGHAFLRGFDPSPGITLDHQGSVLAVPSGIAPHEGDYCILETAS